MKTSSMAWALVVIAVAVGALYLVTYDITPPTDSIPPDARTLDVYQSSDAGVSTNSQASSESTTLGGEKVLSVATDEKLGKYIVGFLGATVYVYSKDLGGSSTCYDTCALNWPPYVVSKSDALTVGDGVVGKVGTTERSDGSLQVTYNGQPLYFYAKDLAPGDIRGNGLNNTWSIVKL